MSSIQIENVRREHHETIHDAYEVQYYCGISIRYRHRNIYKSMFDGLDRNGKSVADLACGSGRDSPALGEYSLSARTMGFVVSGLACRDHKTRTDSDARIVDLARHTEFEERFDAVTAVGGLQHRGCELPTTLAHIARL